jgi:hypothetical protein
VRNGFVSGNDYRPLKRRSRPGDDGTTHNRRRAARYARRGNRRPSTGAICPNSRIISASCGG